MAADTAPQIETLDTGTALAWETRLFEEVARRPEKRFLKVWQGSQSLVVPKKLAAKPGFDTVTTRLASDGWPVHVRATGGDATPQGPGIVNVTHVYTWDSGGAFDIPAAYHRLCAPIKAALGSDAAHGWQPGAFCDGAYNVQWNGLKFAGTALRFRPCRTDKTHHTVLAHALMLFAPPPPSAIAAINRLLSELDEPRTILAEAHIGLPNGRTAEDFIAALIAGFEGASAAE
ncbi:MAG: lipoate--protein ligase family protein [Paracoccaceae bacterium]